MREPKRILFFHQGRLADWAGAVRLGLGRQFPEAEILTFDLHQLVKDRLGLLAANLIATAKAFALDLALGRRDLDDAFFTTPYLFRAVRNLSREIHKRNPCDFSFQMHSMHDHSHDGVPHFVYTDFTYENCRRSLPYRQHRWAPPRADWLIELEREIYAHAACTFVQSQFVADTLTDVYGIQERKVLNVSYGSNIDRQLLERLATGLDRYGSKTILFVGGDWKRKGGPELLSAFREIRTVMPDAKLMVVGCSPKVHEAGVEIVGKVPLNQLPRYYASSAVFCMPSRLEPSAAVYVEAMHAGLPVVALNEGSVREVVLHGETGLLVSPDDRVELASALLTLLQKPDMAWHYGIKGRERAATAYVWENVFSTIGQSVRQELQIEYAVS